MAPQTRLVLLLRCARTARVLIVLLKEEREVAKREKKNPPVHHQTKSLGEVVDSLAWLGYATGLIIFFS